ncbi:MAG: hypothetical protein R3B53_04070 [Candidatus Paceibacterota bacterium]
MDFTVIFHYVTEFAYVLIIFGTLLIWAIWVGRQSLINIVCSVYVTTLLFSHFNLFEALVSDLGKPLIISGAKIGTFIVISVLITKIFKKIMPREYAENKFESLGKKYYLLSAPLY